MADHHQERLRGKAVIVTRAGRWSPGPMWPTCTPPRRIGRPEAVAMTAVPLASDEGPFINAAPIAVDGGRSVLYHG